MWRKVSPTLYLQDDQDYSEKVRWEDRDVQHWLVLVRKFQLCGKVIKGLSFLLQRRLRIDPTARWKDGRTLSISSLSSVARIRVFSLEKVLMRL
jgi:hypothetical protein